MKTLNLVAASLLALGLSACGGSEQVETASTPASDASSLTSDGSGMDHGDHAMDKSHSGDDMKALFGEDYQKGDIGHAYGTVQSINADRTNLVIDHGPIHGIDMAAMTMGFDVLAEADLSGIEEGDRVEFLVRKGRDGSYRIMTICTMKDDDVDCLDGAMNKDDNADHKMDSEVENIGRATGTIRSVGAQGNFLTIDHGPFEGGINMGAMTMGFDTMGDVDLSEFSDGDEVAIVVKQGRDGSFRIMAICDTGTNGADCLDGMMDFTDE
ncbi:MAG: copper-binding protein [Pseudomonadota bacterium]